MVNMKSIFINNIIDRLIKKEYLTDRERREWLNYVKEYLNDVENENQELEKALKILKNKYKFSFLIDKEKDDSWLDKYHLKDNTTDIAITISKEECEALNRAFQILLKRGIL